MRRFIILTVFVLLMSFGTALASDKTYLVVMSSTSTGNSVFTYVYHTVPNLETCYDMVKNSSVNIPAGGDSESVIALYCAPNKGKILSYKEMIK